MPDVTDVTNVTTVAMSIERNNWESAGQATVTFTLDPKLMYFRGHFPHHPILPAVAQLKLLQDALTELEPGLKLAGAQALKFTHILRPGDMVKLELKFNRASGNLAFNQYLVVGDTDVPATTGHIKLVVA
ncbi:MAG TPA: hypothetical protein H9898_01990 [Candidatus Anaerobiospirillum stercoravium]|nr:hypothetical protein [Candidatus Anaerobiospirillum stercoravium]